MATLIAAYRGREIVGRCDARCYEARTPGCHCICYGANHGMGYHQALQQTRRHGERWLARYLEERHLLRDQVTVTGRGIGQMEMILSDSGMPSERGITLVAQNAGEFWAVHQNPIDAPGWYLARLWQVQDGLVRPRDSTRSDRSLDALAEQRPAGWLRIPPGDNDPPTLCEVWVPPQAAGNTPDDAATPGPVEL